MTRPEFKYLRVVVLDQNGAQADEFCVAGESAQCREVEAFHGVVCYEVDELRIDATDIEPRLVEEFDAL